MLTRSTGSIVTFANPSAIGQSAEDLPPGTYVVVVEEERLQGLSFEAYRRVATYVLIAGNGMRAGQTSMHMTTQADLEHAIARDRALSARTQNSEAALSPLEYTT